MNQILFPQSRDFRQASVGLELVVGVELGRSTIQHLMGEDFMNEQVVRDFLWRNRMGIEAAIKAHLFARGIPLDRHFVMSVDDLYAQDLA